MKLINNSTRNYIAYDIILETGKILELDDKKQKLIIDLFKKQPGVEEYIGKEDIKKLKDEIKNLKQEKEKKEENNNKESKN